MIHSDEHTITVTKLSKFPLFFKLNENVPKRFGKNYVPLLLINASVVPALLFFVLFLFWEAKSRLGINSRLTNV